MGYDSIKQNLIVGDQETAHDLKTLQKLGVTHIVSCGFEKGFFSNRRRFKYFLVNVLDVPSSNLLQYLPRVTKFIHQALKDDGVVYVHCVHGQSRSCAVCVAFLLTRYEQDTMESSCSLHEEDSATGEIDDSGLLRRCYDVVATARPCAAVNPGFMVQLEIFRRMRRALRQTKTTPSPVVFARSRSHAVFRVFRAKSDFHHCGVVERFCPVRVDASSERYCYVCRTCGEVLLADDNVVLELSPDDLSRLPTSDYWTRSAGGRDYSCALAASRNHGPSYSNDCFEKALAHVDTILKTEPMRWMRSNMLRNDGSFESRGSLRCPKCEQGLGLWDWCHPESTSCILLFKAKFERRESRRY